MGRARLTFHEVDEARWPDLERLFEAKGGPKYCWCMAWRARGSEATRLDRAARKRALRKRVRDGEPIGILAYSEGEPIAWCSVAPRESYRELGGPAARPRERIWSVVCFYVKKEHRRAGVQRQLLAAATKVARKHGATTLEAYPVDPSSPSYRFMGFVDLFADAGFDEVGRAGSRRHVFRRALRVVR
jgi:GNAT superfamily N-acetyltransferase